MSLISEKLEKDEELKEQCKGLNDSVNNMKDLVAEVLGDLEIAR